MHADARPDGADRVVWTVRADDPWTVIDRPDDGDPDTAEPIARRVADEHGLRLEHVLDTDDIDGVNYYEWALLVPLDQDGARPTDGPPPGVAAVLSALREALPHESLRWSADLDAELTWWLQATQAVRRAHLPLIDALEAALLPLRVDGAQDLDPSVGVRRLGGEQVVGDYGIALCRQPSAAAWCVLRAGIAADLPLRKQPRRRLLEHEAKRSCTRRRSRRASTTASRGASPTTTTDWTCMPTTRAGCRSWTRTGARCSSPAVPRCCTRRSPPERSASTPTRSCCPTRRTRATSPGCG